MRRAAKALGLLAVVGLLVYGAAYAYFHAGSPSQTCGLVARWGGSSRAAPRLNRPMGMAWWRDNLFVADTEDGTVEQYRPDGSLSARWTGFRRPIAVAPADQGVYVADFLADQVVRLAPDGRILARWGRHGTGPGEFDGLGGIAVDRQGNVYVSDFYNHRIQRFDADGRFLGQWGGKGRTGGRFQYPTGIAIGDRGAVYVADAFNHRIQVFGPEGEYRRQWGGIGFGLGGGWPGWFLLAKEIALDARGDVYVADAFNGRIQKFTPEGELLAIWDSGDAELRYPSGVAVGPRGTLYVAEFYANRISELQCR